MTTAPPAQKPSDDEIVEAVEVACYMRGSPVTTTGWVTEQLDIKREATKLRLDRLAADEEGIPDEEARVGKIKVHGESSVWWPLEGERSAINAELLTDEAVDWGQINPEAIPIDVLEEITDTHPEFHKPSSWDVWADRGRWILGISLTLTVLGLGAIVLHDNFDWFNVGSDMQGVVVLFIFGGLLFMLIGLLIVAASNAGESLSDSRLPRWLKSLRKWM